MNPQDPLAQLKPLRLPDADFSWPLAPGWWLLALLALIVISAMVWLLYRRFKRSAVIRQARRELVTIALNWQRPDDSAAACQAINALLKSVALHYDNRSDVAALSGDIWKSYLLQSVSERHRHRLNFDLIDWMYTPNTERLWQERATYLDSAKNWLKHYRGGSHA